jgi:hypothetical protein
MSKAASAEPARLPPALGLIPGSTGLRNFGGIASIMALSIAAL